MQNTKRLCEYFTCFAVVPKSKFVHRLCLHIPHIFFDLRLIHCNRSVSSVKIVVSVDSAIYGSRIIKNEGSRMILIVDA